MSTNRLKSLKRKSGIVGRVGECGNHRLCGRLARSERKRGDSGINDINARLDCLEQRHRSKPRRVVRVQLERQVYLRLDSLDKLLCGKGGKQTRHILYADGGCAHVGNSRRVFCKRLTGVHGAGSVRDSDLNMSALALCSVDSGLEVAGVVQRIKNTDNVDAVSDRLLYEICDNVVGVMTVAEDVLTAEKHLELGILDRITDNAESLPRVLAEKAQACIEGCTAPCLESMVADLVHSAEHGKHILGSHSCSNKRLMRIAQTGLADLDLFVLCHEIDSFLKNRLLSEGGKQHARGDRRADNSGHIRSHRVHEQEVGGVLLLSYRLSDTRRHRNS